EATGLYKPVPGAYLGTADILGIAPDELCLVAAHHSDLAAARAAGLKTAFVARPMEYGGAAAPDAHMAQDWDWSATDIADLASQIDG
ncbi:MAG: haloacid dehalogenase type II, partial [Zymomonas sp.]|nr:haloacid dehalogenase type II [Zymomonas sp.]